MSPADAPKSLDKLYIHAYMYLMKRSVDEARATRASILAAGLASFAELGWEKTTFIGVGARAGVTRGAVHHHFPDKLGLLTAALDEGWADAVAPLLAALAEPGTPGQERLVAFVSSYVRSLTSDDRFRKLAIVSTIVAPQAVAIEPGLAAKQRAMSAWEDGIRAALADTRRRRGVTAEVAVLAIVTVIHGLTMTAATQPELLPADTAGARALALACIHGLVA
ncbi:TetR/AcrR family transcriptional regulator [Nocardia sp. NPDC050793]|uniref:TetR/AcrR family transcriptional regulator n=1 Tax=Nocardia sp. NPDC050793 TaxID=3155159 RepID=UPI0033CE46D8